MKFENALLIGLIIDLQEQSQLLMQYAELFQIIVEDEEGEDILPSIHNLNPRCLWMLTRYGTFWEKDIPNSSPEFFKESFRIDKKAFPLLVHLLKGMEKKDTKFRKSIALEKRIAIALYTLGSSSEYRTVETLFGVSTSSVCNILHEFCRAVIENLSEEFLPANFLTANKVEECVIGFNDLGFPQCLGAIDGCHIEVRPPASEAIDYYNYKGWYSVVLFALVDYRYRFLYVNIGFPGRCNDSQIYRNSQLNKMIDSSLLLKEKSIEICQTQVPILLIGDSAFKFSERVMKPYPFSTCATLEQQMFNYHLSKARRVVENAFGHLKARFRRIGKGMDNHQNAINDSWKIDQNESRIQPDDYNISADWSEPAEDIIKAIAKYVTER